MNSLYYLLPFNVPPLFLFLLYLAIADVVFDRKIPLFVILLGFAFAPGVLLLPLRAQHFPFLLSAVFLLIFALAPISVFDQIVCTLVYLFYPHIFFIFLPVFFGSMLLYYFFTRKKIFPVLPFVFFSFAFSLLFF